MNDKASSKLQEPAPPVPVITNVTFSQEADTYSRDSDQTIKVIIENAGDDDEYFVIETTRWAFNDLNELVATLERAGCKWFPSVRLAPPLDAETERTWRPTETSLEIKL